MKVRRARWAPSSDELRREVSKRGIAGAARFFGRPYHTVYSWCRRRGIHEAKQRAAKTPKCRQVETAAALLRKHGIRVDSVWLLSRALGSPVAKAKTGNRRAR